MKGKITMKRSIAFLTVFLVLPQLWAARMVTVYLGWTASPDGGSYRLYYSQSGHTSFVETTDVQTLVTCYPSKQYAFWATTVASPDDKRFTVQESAPSNVVTYRTPRR